MGQAFQGYLELTGAQIADRMTVAFDALFAYARQLSEAAASADPDPPDSGGSR